MEEIKIHADKIELIDIDEIVLNPKNNNQHPEAQINQLVKIIKYNGFRSPPTISNRTGFLVCGEGRIQAAKLLGMTKIPVMFQDFENEAAEYSHLTADNAVQAQSILDYAKVNEEIINFGPDYDIDWLGIKDFKLNFEKINFEAGSIDEQGKLDEKKPLVTQCPNCGECFDANENKSKN